MIDQIIDYNKEFVARRFIIDSETGTLEEIKA